MEQHKRHSTFGQQVDDEFGLRIPMETVSIYVPRTCLKAHNLTVPIAQWTAPRGWMGRIDMEVVATDDVGPCRRIKRSFPHRSRSGNGRPVLEPVRQLRPPLGKHLTISSSPTIRMNDALMLVPGIFPEARLWIPRDFCRVWSPRAEQTVRL